MNDFYSKLLAAIEEAKQEADRRLHGHDWYYYLGIQRGLERAKGIYEQCVADDLAKRMKGTEGGDG